MAEFHANVSACILDRFTELDKALFSSRQYILTLWPAFVGAIVALAPDPGQMVYDNIWWSALFALTCGGLPGLDSSAPPHHVEALSEQEGRAKCESWEYTDAKPKDISKSEARGDRDETNSYIWLEWTAFFVSFGLWVGFCVYFIKTIRPAVDFVYYSKDWPRGAIWYLISSGPAFAALVFELIQNRVELFEPAASGHVKEAQERTNRDIHAQVSSTLLPVAGVYVQVKTRSVFHLWSKVVRYQWHRSKYRILIRDPPSHVVLLVGRAIVGICRVAFFATASVVMGNILFMPVPDDFYLFILLLATTAVPRQIWSGLWANGNGGADLVVVVKSIRVR